MKRRILGRVLVVLAALLVAVLAVGFAAGAYFVELALNPHSDKSLVMEAEHNEVDYGEDAQTRWQGWRDWFTASAPEDVYIHSGDGFRLHAFMLAGADGGAGNWAILCHGYNGSGAQTAGVAMEFQKRGYSVLMPDARACGESEGDYLGMGWPDRLDILDWADEINARFAPANIVLHGVSMGGATVMMAAGEVLPANVRAVVEDCGYTSAYEEFRYQLKGLFGLPAFPLMNFSSAVTRMWAGYWLEEADALAQVEKAKVPILFIHGEEDTFVPAAMVQVLYDACPAEKQLLVVPGAGHGGAGTSDEALYWNTIDAFLAQHLI